MSWAEAKWVRDQVLAAVNENNNSEITTNTVVTITQIPNNQYGYFIKLTDIDGETPLADVIVSGVTDPDTELRTNAKGELKFYSSAASHNVTWSNLPGHLSNDMFPNKLQGYVNDLTSTIVKMDTSNFYGYHVTIKDHDGNPMKNTPVYTSAGGAVFKTTDSNGQIGPFYSTANTQALFVRNGSSDGFYYFNGNASGTKGQVVESEVQCNTALYTGNTAVGETISFKGKNWVVAHRQDNNIYCSGPVSEFKTDEPSQYASVAAQYQTQLGLSDVENILIPDTTIYDVTAKIFTATYEQLNGEWSYFNSNEHRIGYNENNEPQYYFIIGENNKGRYAVYPDGRIVQVPSGDYYFRPSVCLPLA